MSRSFSRRDSPGKLQGYSTPAPSRRIFPLRHTKNNNTKSLFLNFRGSTHLDFFSISQHREVGRFALVNFELHGPIFNFERFKMASFEDRFPPRLVFSKNATLTEDTPAFIVCISSCQSPTNSYLARLWTSNWHWHRFRTTWWWQKTRTEETKGWNWNFQWKGVLVVFLQPSSTMHSPKTAHDWQGAA